MSETTVARATGIAGRCALDDGVTPDGGAGPPRKRFTGCCQHLVRGTVTHGAGRQNLAVSASLFERGNSEDCCGRGFARRPVETGTD